ncbi:MAG: sulfatase [Planctomycetota bacterium]
MLTRSSFTLFGLLALTLFQPLAIDCVAAEKRPNVLFIISDDLNNALGCYGHPLVKTPNIDRFAARGVLFQKAYCQYAVCGPSRNSMLTGLYPNTTGILANRQIFRQTIPTHVSLSQAFRLEGYLAARVGKLYHHDVPKAVGTDGHEDPASWEVTINPAGCDRLIEEPDIFTLQPGNFGSMLSWYASPRDDRSHTDGMLATEAEWILERCARQPERPFFLAVGFFRPHTPFVAPQTYFNQYPAEAMPIVRGIKEDRADLPPDALGSVKKIEESLSDDLKQQAVRGYFASISFMDAQVGRLLDALDRLNLADNTIVVFTSDHGYHLGEHGLWKKLSLFEESARVPLIIAAPGARRGAVAKAPVGLIDLYPTLTELCDVESPTNLQGQSLAPMLSDPSHAGRNWALTQVSRGSKAQLTYGYSIRTPRWRYTEWDEGRRGRELYDHETDPRELNNLIDEDVHRGLIGELSNKLRNAVSSTYPESGQTPTVREGLWAPKLTTP